MTRWMRPMGMLVCIASMLIAPLAGAELRSAWDCLPNETVLAMRVPSLKDSHAALAKHTKLGATLLTRERYEKIVKLIEDKAKEEGGDLEEVNKQLGKYGLKIEDFLKFGEGSVGGAWIIERRPKRMPLNMMLVWAEPGEDAAGRMFKALGDAYEDAANKNKDNERFPTRADFKLEGLKVMHFTTPEIHKEVPPDFWQFPEDMDFNDQEAVNRFYREREEKYKAIKPVKMDQTNVFVTHIKGRMLMLMTFPQNADAVSQMREEKGKDAKIDFEAVTGVREATGVLARFIKAHGGGEPGFSRRVLATPGMRDALPQGHTHFEMLADFQPFMKMIEDEDVLRLVKAFGVADVGAAGYRLTQDGPVIRQGMFVAAPSPRKGLMALLDQPNLASKPPKWVSNDVVSYSHFSLDLAKAYQTIKTSVTQEIPTAAMGFMMVENQMKQNIQIELSDLLASLGSKHTIVQFLPTYVPAAKRGDDQEPIQQHMGFVWQLQNDNVWAKLLDTYKKMMEGMGGDQIKFVDEQGFSGVRIDAPEQKMALFRGRGYLSLSLGDQTAERVLSLLRKGDAGSDAMGASKLMDEAARLIKPRPAIAYGITDSNRVMNALVDAMYQALDDEPQVPSYMLPDVGMEGEDVEDDRRWVEEFKKSHKKTMAEIKKFMPKREELKDLFGVGVGVMYMNQHGLVVDSATAATPPDK